MERRAGYATRVILSKSAQSIENKGRERRKKPQESLRVRKRKEVKELEGAEERKEIAVRFVRGSGMRVVVRRWVAIGGLGGRFFRLRLNLALRRSARSGASGRGHYSAHFME